MSEVPSLSIVLNMHVDSIETALSQLQAVERLEGLYGKWVKITGTVTIGGEREP